MAYVEDNLVYGEAVTHQTRLHWIALFWPALIAVACALGGFALLGSGITTSKQSAGTMAIAGLALLVAAGGSWGIAVLKRRSAEFAVTNKRVIVKVGIVERRTAEMFLSKIESVGVDQTMPGRILNYGRITLRGTGGTAETFDRIARPLEFRKQVLNQIAMSAERGAAAGTF
jgi:uncharacterized membrane protein YdbT with pleckstrin-like domain